MAGRAPSCGLNKPLRLFTNRHAERAGGLHGVCWDKWDFRDLIVAVWDLREGLQLKNCGCASFLLEAVCLVV